MKKLIKCAFLGIFLSCFSTLSGCAKENKYTRVGVNKNVDGINLYLSGVALGNLGSTYVYLGDALNSKNYAEEVERKMSKSHPDCDIAYFPVNDTNQGLKYLFTSSTIKDKISVVYFDNFTFENNEYKANGVWIARDGWMETKNTSKTFLTGFAKTAQYRYEHQEYALTYKEAYSGTFNSYKEMFTYIRNNQDKLPEFSFNDYKNIYEHSTMFALQNPDYFLNDEKIVSGFVISSHDNGKTPFIDNNKAKEIFGSSEKEDGVTIPEAGQKIINDLKTKIGITSEKSVNIKKMQYAIYHASDASPDKKTDLKTIIIWCVIGGIVLFLSIYLIVRSRLKTGTFPFSIKKALDSDIDPEDPQVIRMRKVGNDLKILRESRNISIEEAAKGLHMRKKFLTNIIEAGEIVLSKKQRKKYIEYFHLEPDYFDKAYKIEE